MPETPDFKALAYRVASMNCESIGLLDEEIRHHPDALDDTVAFLKEVWNARGAADIAKLEALEVIPDHVSDDALRTLDR